MGMFTSLFGSSGSDKADRLRQQAIDAFNAVKTPDLASLQVQLQKSVLAGKITPEEAEATLLNSNAFNAIKADPNLVGAQKQALQSLQDTASAGGLTAVDKAQLQDITDTQNQENKSSSDAIIANARARGVGNSNLSAVQRLISEQGSADRAAKSGLGVASLAQTRALEALKAAGAEATSMRSQDVGEQTAKAQAQNDIDKFNAANKTDISKTNVGNDLSAQGANLATAQHVNDENTSIGNTETINNANANQTIFNDEMGKAAGKAGVLNGWANQANKDAAADKAGDVSLTSGLVQAGGSALAGPIGGMAAGGATSGMDSAPAGYKPKMAPNQEAVLGYSEGGEVKDPNSSNLEDEYNKFVQSFCNGGTVNMADGGKVTVKPGKALPITGNADGAQWDLKEHDGQPVGSFNNYSEAADFARKVQGKAEVPGDSPKNDKVPAMLSPDEVVASRSEAANFEKLTGTPLEEALKRLKSPQVGSVRG